MNIYFERGELFVVGKEATRYEKERNLTVAEREESNLAEGENGSRVSPGKSGAPKGRLREVVERLYLEILNSGENTSLKPGKINLFMEELRKKCNKENGDLTAWDMVGIEIKKKGRQWQITIEGGTTIAPNGREITDPKKKYVQNDVSKILTEQRKNDHLSI